MNWAWLIAATPRQPMMTALINGHLAGDELDELDELIRAPLLDRGRLQIIRRFCGRAKSKIRDELQDF